MLNTIDWWRATSASKFSGSSGLAAVSNSVPVASAVPILLGTYTRRMGRRDAARTGLFLFGLRRRRRAHADDLQQARLVLRAVVVNLFRRVDDEAAGGHRLEPGRIVLGARVHPPGA